MSLRAEQIAVVYRSGIFSRHGRTVLDGASLELRPGETFGLMGPSGSGKSTFARVLAGLERPAAGQVRYRGRSLAEMGRAERAVFRRNVQVMFQDPTAALNPAKTIGRSMEDVLRLLGRPKSGWTAGTLAALDRVGLTADVLVRTPAQLSGGQNQRVALARILLLEPEYILLDEPTSALDVSVQAQVLRLLRDVQAELGIGYLLISHDPSIVGFMADRIGAIRDGKVVEYEE
ncbi:MAG: peptide/nickel transport system ATP-binding protein [Methanofollis sp.]|nr:peptide/nickel transport system ATP-binding protein [Methanofollis sp.]